MPSRNAKTRKISWRIACNPALAKSVKDVGWEASWIFTNIIASADNLGRMEGGIYQLRDMFFPHFPMVTPDVIEKCLKSLSGNGLIIHYQHKDMWYIQLPKIGNWSKIVGHMVKDSDFPPPSNDILTAWEQRFSDVYTPVIPSTNSSVHTAFIQRSNGVRSEVEVEVEVEVDKRERQAIALIEFLNQAAGTKFNPNDRNVLKEASARLSEDYEFEDMKLVVLHKTKLWKNNPEMVQFLRPSTLFAKKHMGDYIGAAKSQPKRRSDGGK